MNNEDYAPDVNYGNRFPDDWYLNDDKKASVINTLQTQDDYKKCYKPYRTLNNYSHYYDSNLF